MLKDIHKMTEAEKRFLTSGEPEFDSQDDKIKVITDLVNVLDSLLISHAKAQGKDLNTFLMVKLIKYFLEEHKDVLEQYELDYKDEQK